MLGLFFLLIIVIGIVLAINGDKWYPSKYHTTYICNIDGEVVDMFEDHTRPIDNDPYDDDEDEMYERESILKMMISGQNSEKIICNKLE